MSDLKPHPPVPQPESMSGWTSLLLRQRTEWDMPPELGVVCSRAPGHVSFHAAALPAAFWDVVEDPVTGLERLFRVWSNPERTLHALRRAFDGQTHGMIGLYVVYEGYRSTDPADRARANQAFSMGYRWSIANGNGRECRNVNMTMLDGMIHQVTQERARPTKLNHQYQTAKSGVQWAGRMVEAMTMLTAAVHVYGEHQ